MDRDGVINHDYGYVHRIEDFHFCNGIFDLCGKAQELGYLIFVITNQAGIARGYFSEEDFMLLMSWVSKRFEENGTPITGVYFCPFHETEGKGNYKKFSMDRKPNPGMLVKARDDHKIDMAKSVFIGDKMTDIEAGIKANVKTNILLTNDAVKFEIAHSFKVVRTLYEAAHFLN